MRSLPPWIWLVLAGVSGLAAALLALTWLQGQAHTKTAPQATAPVVLARQEIPSGARLTSSQMQVRADWPKENLPRGAFARVEELEGRITATPLASGEPITEHRLAPKGTPPTLTSLLPPHKRAMTVKVDEASGVAGFLAPDNRVDVVVTMDKGEHSKNPLSRVLLQNLKVLGTGQRTESRPGDKPQVVPTVTLEVTAAEGERLALASLEGRISLVLRGQEDDHLIETQGTDANRLFGPLAMSPAPRPPMAHRRIVEVIRGLDRQQTNY